MPHSYFLLGPSFPAPSPVASDGNDGCAAGCVENWKMVRA